MGLELAEKMIEATKAKAGGPRRRSNGIEVDLPEKRVLNTRVAVPVAKAGTSVVVIGWWTRKSR